jgi:hypothetical protein
VVATAAAGATFGSAAGAVPAAPAAQCTKWVSAGDSGPPSFTPRVKCVQWSSGGPPSGGNGNGNQNGNGNGNGDGAPDPNNCRWELYPVPAGVTPDRPAGVSPDATMYWEICTNALGVDYVGPGGTQWFGPGQVPLPSPQQVAQQFQVEISTKLRVPALTASPPIGTRSTVHVPTFVAVSNWQGQQTAGGCDPTGTVCVNLTATPKLTFAPGETGSRTVRCEDGGTRYDPAGAPPAERAAAPGACAWNYQYRTGAGGRPAEWPGQVTVTWAVHWQQPGGQGGDFPDIALSTDMPRAVQEIQGVVTGAGT